MQTVDPNWPSVLSSVNELTTVCTTSEDSAVALGVSVMTMVLMSAVVLLFSA